MRHKSKIMCVVLLLLFTFAGSNLVIAKTNDVIIFKDKYLQEALRKYYELNSDIITKERASDLSKQWYNALVIENSDISDLEGLQYFDNMISLYIGGNSLLNFKPLSMLNKLGMLNISNNAFKSIKLEKALYEMGKIDNLDMLILEDNRIANIDFLQKIGNMNNYTHLDLSNNNIWDISILENATNLETLHISDNRITDVSPLENLKNFKYWLDLKDNCIIDYKPVKSILDEIYESGGWEDVISRYDYYTNPVDVGVDGKTIKFPYLTAYYKYQPYAEAIPLFQAIGGSAVYIKHMGILVCRYKGNVLAMADFSERCMLNGEVITLDYPMRRMQYDLAYVPVKDICEALGFKYHVTEEREIYENEDEGFYVPMYVEISTD